MSTSVEISGVESTRRFLKNKKLKIDVKEVIGLNKAALFLQGEVKSSIAGRRPEPTSVDTGRFLNSVDMAVQKTSAQIFSNLAYSKHLEHGTSRIKSRRHFNNSKDRSKQKIAQIIQREIDTI